MSTSVRTVALAAAALFAVSGPGAPQVGEILKLPESVWTDINRFVFLVAFDVYQPGVTKVAYQHHLSQLDSYPELYAACRQWGQETFPALQRLAADLAKDDIGSMLTAMKGASEAIAAGRGDPGNVFESNAAALEGRFAALGVISDTVTRQMTRLRTASKATINEYKLRRLPPTEFVEVRANPDAVITALNAANNHWIGLQSDVKELRRLVAKAQGSPTAELYARIGFDTWKDIARSAQGFMTDVPRQQRFLSGENYYDYVSGPREGWWYTIVNAAVSRNASYGMLPDRGPRLLGLGWPTGKNAGVTPGFDPGLTLRLNTSTEHGGGKGSSGWKFLKIEKGWYRIINRQLGDAKALDGGIGPARVVPLGAYSGQYWRILPASKFGTFRLINSYVGDLSSLTAKRRAGPGDPVYDVVLAATTTGLDQQWELTDATWR
jgi:hypothetical protein